MLDYRTAKDLCAEINAKIAENPKFKEDTIWEEFVSSSIRYVRHITDEYLRDKKEFDKYAEKDENGLTVQEFLNSTAESALNMLRSSLVAQLALMDHLLSTNMIETNLPDDKTKCEFAWYVAMFEVHK